VSPIGHNSHQKTPGTKAGFRPGGAAFAIAKKAGRQKFFRPSRIKNNRPLGLALALDLAADSNGFARAKHLSI